jgi:ABC-type branched-subunit amino acid transport system ATPase component
MLNVITGFVLPSAGEVRICDVRSNRLTPHRRVRLGLARTFQRAALFPELSVGEHLTLAAEVRHLWRRAPSEPQGDGAPEVAELLAQPPWMLAPDQPISNLSLGAIRIVELGMALTARPRVLLLDEPLSGLDQVERAALGDLLLDVRQRFGLTIVLVEHDVESVVRLAERLVVLDFGQKIADGPTATIIQDPKVRQAYFGGSEA